MRVQILLETTNFSLFSEVSDYNVNDVVFHISKDGSEIVFTDV